MFRKYRNLIVLVAAFLIMAGSAQAELFKSLECGLSFEYSQDLEPNVLGSTIIEFSGPENVKVLIYKFDKSREIATVDDLILLMETSLEKVDPLFVILSSENKNNNGVDIIEKRYSYAVENEYSSDTMDMRNLYFGNGDTLELISFISEDYYYDRADKMYFTNIVDSLNIFLIDETLSENIPGFPKITPTKIWSSPLLADIDGDGSLEIIVGTNDNKLYAWKKDGSNAQGFPYTTGDQIRSSPAGGDVNGDGVEDIVVGSDDGKLYVLNGDGSDQPGFPKKTEGCVRSSPALGDINGDGFLEIFFGSMDTGIYAFSKDGFVVCGFPIITGNSNIGGIWSSPALGDINGDGKLEIVIGTTRTEEGYILNILPIDISSGKIFALNFQGNAIDGFPVSLCTGIPGTTIGYSSPVLADLDGDGLFEIIFGSSDGLNCLAPDGEEMPGFPITTDGSLQDSFIAVGDLEEDGSPEIVSGCRDGRLYVWRSNGSNYPGFPIQTGGFVRHVTLGDIDNDGKQEILGGSSDNRVYAWKLDGSVVSGFPKVTLDDIETAPTLGDLEGDGSLELAVGSNDGSLYVWMISQSFGKLQWPMTRQNPQHTGVYKPN